LEHLDAVSRTFVPGADSRLREHYPDIADAPLTRGEFMEDWQVPLMAAMTEAAAAGKGDVLEIGFGRGVSAEMLQQAGVRSHTIVEPNPHSIKTYYEPWRTGYPDRDIRLIEGRWQEVLDQLELYDAVFFHPFPLNEQEYIEQVVKSITYAEHAMPGMAACLRPGGVFTYLSAEIDTLSRRHQRLLFSHFASLSLSRVQLKIPPDTRDTWWCDSMVVVKAEKAR
ncbi:MAG: class I SAM-dependent methyltransferase, partial [Verrucomicrobiota bacterium]